MFFVQVINKYIQFQIKLATSIANYLLTIKICSLLGIPLWKKKIILQALLVTQVIKNLPAHVRRRRFHPWLGKIPHALEQLSPCTQPLSLCSRAQEPEVLNPEHPRACAQRQEKPPQEACTQQLESNTCSLQLEKSPCINKDPA